MLTDDRGRAGRTPMRKRVLALIASLSMLMVGLVGVVTAPAASAHTPNISASCQNGLSVNLTQYATQQGKTNHVKIVIDSATVVDQDFGSSYSYSNPLSPKTANHTWSVAITAWDNNAYSKNFSGSTTACEQEKVQLTAEICHKDGQSGNYSYITPSFSSVINQVISDSDIPNGHGTHSGDIIKPIEVNGFTYYAGKNWDAAGQAIFRNGCALPVFKAEKVLEGTIDYCLAGQNGTAPWSVTGKGESTVSQEDAQAKADADAASKVDAAKAAALPEGAKAGKCEVFKADKTLEGSFKYCLNEVTGTANWSVTGHGESTISLDDAKAKALADANSKVAAAKAAALPEGATEGKCIYKYSVTKTAEATICYAGETINVKVSGDKVTIPEQDDPITPEQIAAADKKAQDSADAALAKELNSEYEGYKEGECVPAANGSLSCEAGLSFTLTDYPAGAEVLITGMPGGNIVTEVGKDGSLVYGPTGGPLPDGSYEVNVYVNGFLDKAKAAAVNLGEPVLTLTVECTPEGKTYSAGASTQASLKICTAAGVEKTVIAQGSGVGTSPNSQASAQAAADNAAAAEAQANLKKALEQNAPFTEGACTAVGSTSVAVPAPAVVAAPAPAKAPAKVTVPAAATLPGSVPAGDGSQAPGTPMWAIMLLIVGALGAAGAGLRIAGDRK
jgi:hypothetical protein